VLLKFETYLGSFYVVSVARVTTRVMTSSHVSLAIILDVMRWVLSSASYWVTHVDDIFIWGNSGQLHRCTVAPRKM